MVPWTCPECSKQYRFSEDRVGKKVRCKACKVVSVVTQTPKASKKTKPPEARVSFEDIRASARNIQLINIGGIDEGDGCLAALVGASLFPFLAFLMAVLDDDTPLGLAFVIFVATGWLIAAAWVWVYINARRLTRRRRINAENSAHRIQPTHRAIRCTCKKCRTRFVIGVNAVAVTTNQSLQDLEERGGGFSIGQVPEGTPDSIALIMGEESWPKEKKVPKPRNPIDDEILEAKASKSFRQWMCRECNSTTAQPYPWCDSSDSRSGGES